MEELGKRVGIAIKNAGITQKILAERIGTEQSTISGYVTGRRDIKMSVLVSIAKATGVSVNWLYNGIDDLDDKYYLIDKIKELDSYIEQEITSCNDAINLHRNNDIIVKYEEGRLHELTKIRVTLLTWILDHLNKEKNK